MKRYSLYLFDFDGTLMDSFDSLGYIFKESFLACNIKIKDEDIPYLSRVPLSVGYEKMGGKKEDIPTYIDLIKEKLYSVEALHMTRVYDDALHMFKYFKKNNIPFGVVTSNEISHVKDVMDFLGLDFNMFSVVVGSDICKKIKPLPDPILMALELMHYEGDLEDVIYVGDSVNDYMSAVNAKITPMLIVRDDLIHEDKNKIYSLKELYD